MSECVKCACIFPGEKIIEEFLKMNFYVDVDRCFY